MSADRPTLHVTNWSSRRLHGPGRRWTIMRRPRAWEHGDGRVTDLCPEPADLDGWRAGTLSLAEYRARYEAVLPLLWLEPTRLSGLLRDGRATVRDGDTLLCACSRAAAARGECHRSWAAAALAAAAWRVLLDGEEVPRVG